MWLGGVFPITVRANELLLNPLLQVTEPSVVRTIHQVNSPAVQQGANLAEDLSRDLDPAYHQF